MVWVAASGRLVFCFEFLVHRSGGVPAINTVSEVNVGREKEEERREK